MPETKPQPQPQPQLVTVEMLVAGDTHHGIEIPKGARIEVRQALAERMVAAGRAKHI